MIKNLSIFEHKIGEKVFQFIFEPTSSLGELHDALFSMKDFVVQKIKESQDADLCKPKEAPPVEIPPVDVPKE